MSNLLINLCIITPLYLIFLTLTIWLCYNIGMWSLGLLEKLINYKDTVIK